MEHRLVACAPSGFEAPDLTADNIYAGRTDRSFRVPNSEERC